MPPIPALAGADPRGWSGTPVLAVDSPRRLASAMVALGDFDAAASGGGFQATAATRPVTKWMFRPRHVGNPRDDSPDFNAGSDLR